MSEVTKKETVIYHRDPWQEGRSAEVLPENLAEAIRWMQAKLDSIPEEFRDSARVELETVGYPEAEWGALRISYLR